MPTALEEALTKSGVVTKEETPGARQEAEWAERSRASTASATSDVEARASERPSIPFEAPATGRIVERPPAPRVVRPAVAPTPPTFRAPRRPGRR